MKPAVKKFLLIYFTTALVVWLTVSVLLGPPGFSREYRNAFKADHDRYLQIVKSVPHKRYVQRPHLNQPGMEGVPPTFTAESIAFVQEYTSRPQYLAEMRRITFFNTFFRTFNAFLVLWVAWHFGKKPILRLVDHKIHEIREKIAAAQNGRDAAADRKRAAQAKLVNLPESERRALAEAEGRVRYEREQLESAQARRLAKMQRDLEDRRKEEIHQVQMLVKAELVEAAIQQVLAGYRDISDDRSQAALIDNFIAEMEGRRA